MTHTLETISYLKIGSENNFLSYYVSKILHHEIIHIKTLSRFFEEIKEMNLIEIIPIQNYRIT